MAGGERERMQITAGGASSEEAAAVVAALEQFLADTAPTLVPAAQPAVSAWKRAALIEGVNRDLLPL